MSIEQEPSLSLPGMYCTSALVVRKYVNYFFGVKVPETDNRPRKLPNRIVIQNKHSTGKHTVYTNSNIRCARRLNQLNTEQLDRMLLYTTTLPSLRYCAIYPCWSSLISMQSWLFWLQLTAASIN